MIDINYINSAGITSTLFYRTEEDAHNGIDFALEEGASIVWSGELGLLVEDETGE